MAKSSCVSIFAFVAAILGLLANVVSVGTTEWLVSDKMKTSFGVFRHCDMDTKFCGGMSELSYVVDAQEVGK